MFKRSHELFLSIFISLHYQQIRPAPIQRFKESNPHLESETERKREREGQTPSDELYSICQLSVDRLLEVPKGPGSLKFHPYTPNQSLIYGIIRCTSFTLCAHVTMSHKSFGLNVSPLSFPYFLTFYYLFNCAK